MTLRSRQAAAAEQARDMAEAGIGLEYDGSPDYTRAARGLGALRVGEAVATEDRADVVAALLEWCNSESDALEDERVPQDARRVARERLDAAADADGAATRAVLGGTAGDLDIDRGRWGVVDGDAVAPVQSEDGRYLWDWGTHDDGRSSLVAGEYVANVYPSGWAVSRRWPFAGILAEGPETGAAGRRAAEAAILRLEGGR